MAITGSNQILQLVTLEFVPILRKYIKELLFLRKNNKYGDDANVQQECSLWAFLLALLYDKYVQTCDSCINRTKSRANCVYRQAEHSNILCIFVFYAYLRTNSDYFHIQL
jgi:hypothetical protein